MKPPLKGHSLCKETCSLNKGILLIEVDTYKDYMSVNFAGTKVCVPLKEGFPLNGGVPK